MSTLEKSIDYTFTNPAFLNIALRHSSHVNEQPDENLEDNERLEFLGDAALSLCITDMLIRQFTDMSEGVLSPLRAHLVNEGFLAGKARAIHLEDHILLGKGEEMTKGRQKNSILAGAYEALLGAVYADGGFNAVFELVKRQFTEDIEEAASATGHLDHKSLLQEFLQGQYKTSPVYEIIEESGPAHDKTFRCQVSAAEITAEGTGKNKKSAQQEAARKALVLLQND